MSESVIGSRDMLPTPVYCISDDQKESVYDPAEDTFLLMDALEADAQAIRDLDPTIIVEIGCGSGIVTAFVQQILRQTVFAVATDINRKALQCTQNTALLNNIEIEPIQCDLICPMQSSFQELVDILIFNPPYVPTSEEATTDAARCWAGGPTGRGTLDRLMDSVPMLLSARGFFYVVALSTNDIPHMLSGSPKLLGKVMLQRRCGIEYLYVLKFSRR